MTFMQEKIYYFANSVTIVLTFFRLTQRSLKMKNSSDKKSSKKSSQLKQKTITTLLKYKEVWDDFVLDFLKMCTCLTFSNTKLTK